MTNQVDTFFEGWEETLIWSCLQGVMGSVIVDNKDNPKSALAKIGQYGSFGFLAGQPTVTLIEECRGLDIILVPQNEAWESLIENIYGTIARPFTRYATRKYTTFDRKRLADFVAGMPADFEIKQIDEELYEQCLQERWSQDLVGNYENYSEFQHLGLGFVVLHGQQIVSGASSYATYKEGIEIEVDTHPDFRQQGLAKRVSAQLILACLAEGRYPSWDAHNKTSLALAEKLGYVFSHEYRAYEFDW